NLILLDSERKLDLALIRTAWNLGYKPGYRLAVLIPLLALSGDAARNGEDILLDRDGDVVWMNAWHGGQDYSLIAGGVAIDWHSRLTAGSTIRSHKARPGHPDGHRGGGA